MDTFDPTWRLIQISKHDDPGENPGKRPLAIGWQKSPPHDPDTVRRWIADGYNVGLVTGNGIVVIDWDHEEPPPPEYPPTRTVRTGRGWQLYYSKTVEIRNSASKLAPGVDVRGDGGYVVIPPSMHASGRPYTWANDLPIAPLPQWIVEALVKRPKPSPPPPEPVPVPAGGKWARKAFEEEIGRVRASSEGTRNATLFRAAAALSEIVNGGNLGEFEVRAALQDAAVSVGLSAKEAAGTITSAWKATEGKVRVPKPKRPRAPATFTAVPDSMPDDHDLTPTVLVPGAHQVPSNGGEPEYREVTPDEFATGMLAAQKPDVLFHRSGVVGTIRDGAFRILTADGLRLVLTAKPYRYVVPRPSPEDPTPKPAKVYVPMTKELAELVLAKASSVVPEVRLITHTAIYLPDLTLSKPGWNLGGVYHTGPVAAAPHADHRAVFDDLLIDFPFDSQASRENFIGALVGQALIMAIRGNRPMTLMLSTVERAGKSLLVNGIAAPLFLNRPAAAMQFAGSPEEIDKRITATLLRGTAMVHLDNLGEWVESHALASMFTSEWYMGRRLGQSEMIEVENRAMWWATGNNVSMSGELAKRTVCVRLEPKVGAPELRTDFKHPDLAAYVAARRDLILGAIYGMVDAWNAAGRPLGRVAFGGFEGYAGMLGGVMAHAGYTNWMANHAGWTGSADVEHGDMVRFLEACRLAGVSRARVADLRAIASSMGLFERRLGRTSSERGADTAFAGILRRYMKRTVTTKYGDLYVGESFAEGVRMYSIHGGTSEDGGT